MRFGTINYLFILSWALLGLISPASGQATHLVPGEFDTIQEAIDAAVDGDTVLVSPGTYVENISFHGKAILVQSSGEPEETTIDGSSCTFGPTNCSVVAFTVGEGPDSILDGFTITHGIGTAFGGLNGGGIICVNSSPTVRNCTVVDNHVNAGGGGCFLFNSSAVLTDNIIRDNSAIDGGGVVLHLGTSATLNGNIFSGNSAFSLGGGIHVVSDATVVMTNCSFSGNSAIEGGGVSLETGGTITNCTFSANTAASTGGGIRCNTVLSTPVITNCILWGGLPNQISAMSGATPTVTYSDVQDGYAGEGNIDLDPLFLDADGLDDIPGTADDDLHLLPGSPCINGGTNGAPELSATDFEGDPRIICGVVEMGADEFDGCPASFVRGDGNGDGLVDVADPVYILEYLFGEGPSVCLDALDTNDDGAVDIGDPIALLNALFVTGAPPLPAPHPDCGPDPTPDGLGCAAFTACP